MNNTGGPSSREGAGTMAEPQIIKTEDGAELVVLSRGDYDALLARAGAAPPIEDASLPPRIWTLLKAPGSNRLHVLRVHRGMTQDALADAAGVPPENVQAIESGIRRISDGVLRKIAGVLDVPVEVLTG